MKWTAQVGLGAWLRESLTRNLGSLNVTVPPGFSAYVRVLHPAYLVEKDPFRFPDRDDELLVRPLTWGEVAREFGTTLHPLAQFARLAHTDDEMSSGIFDTAGREIWQPNQGCLPPALLAQLTEVLAHHTTTPDDAVTGVWDGCGTFPWSTSAISVGIASPGRPGPKKLWTARRQARRMQRAQEAKRAADVASRRIEDGPRLELPYRDYHLFTSPLAPYIDGSWCSQAPWVQPEDRESDPDSGLQDPQSPSLLWPADHAWVLASEIDFDSTLIACSRDAAAALLALPGVEAFEIPPDAQLTWDGDEVNAPVAPQP